MWRVRFPGQSPATKPKNSKQTCVVQWTFLRPRILIKFVNLSNSPPTRRECHGLEVERGEFISGPLLPPTSWPTNWTKHLPRTLKCIIRGHSSNSSSTYQSQCAPLQPIIIHVTLDVRPPLRLTPNLINAVPEQFLLLLANNILQGFSGWIVALVDW